MAESKVYTITQISEMLSISRSAAYVLVRFDPPFPVLRLNEKSIRIPKKSFDEWFEQFDKRVER